MVPQQLVKSMQPAFLNQPVGSLMRHASSVFIEDSMGVAATCLRDSASPMICVLEGNKLVGVVTEAGIIRALGDGAQHNDPLTLAMEPAPQCRPYSTGAEALRQFDTGGSEALVVADDLGHVAGILQPSDLLQRRYLPLRPSMIGGMATPYGVYLTTGSLGAGVSQWALVTTGMAMSLMLTLAVVVVSLIEAFASHHGISDRTIAGIEPFLVGFAFLLQMRLVPLSGIHAAEHKVVHAIERGEELTRETVQRMPRVHPRCGTNLVVGLSIFTGILGASFLGGVDVSIRTVLAGIATLIFWKPLGSLAQYWITTKPPTEKQLDLGIKSGKDLLEKYHRAHVTAPNVVGRILNSGMLHVMAGAAIMTGLTWLVLAAFGRSDLLPLF